MVEINIKLNNLIQYGNFRFLCTDKKIANACFYDSSAGKYRLGYVVETRDNSLKESYVFRFDTKREYMLPFNDAKKIKKWCFEQSL